MTPYMFVLHKNVISFYVQKRRIKALGLPVLAMFILPLSGLFPGVGGWGRDKPKLTSLISPLTGADAEGEGGVCSALPQAS